MCSSDLLTAAPAPITPQQRKEAGVDTKPAPRTAPEKQPSQEDAEGAAPGQGKGA